MGKKIRFYLLGCLALVASNSFTQTVQANEAGVAVIIYDGSDHSGQSLEITKDMPSLGDMNGRMNSFKVSPGYRVRFFSQENYRGGYYTRSVGDQYGTDALGWDNLIQSIKILSAPDSDFVYDSPTSSTVAVTIYDGKDLTGESLKIYANTPSFGSMNKRMSSYQVSKGFKVRFFSEVNYRGGYYTRDGNKKNEINAQGWDDTVSSVKILAAPAEAPKPDSPPDSPPESFPPPIYVPGQTQVNNGDIVSFEGQCYMAKNNPGVWETPSANSWFWDLVDCDSSSEPNEPPSPPEPEPTPPPVIPTPPEPEANTPPRVDFISPTTGGIFSLGDNVSISVYATDTNLSKVLMQANNEEVCELAASSASQYSCNWSASSKGTVILSATATDAENASTTAKLSIIVNEVQVPTPPEPEAPKQEVGDLCKDFALYPDWPRGDHAIGGDIMVYEGIAYSAIYWTSSIPGSDGSWGFHLNCDGSQPGSAPLLSLRNLPDPISLKLPYWPSTLVIADPSYDDVKVVKVETSTSSNITNTNSLAKAYENLIKEISKAPLASFVISTDVLDKATVNSSAFGSIPVKAALTQAVNATKASISTADINALSNDLKGWARAHHLIFANTALDANFGWLLTIGNFAYDNHSGRRSVWDEASKQSASLLDELALYHAENENPADFVAFNKSSSSKALNSEQWHNALEYIKQVTDFVDAPAILYTVPTDQATLYFMGETNASRQLRKAAYHNVFAIFFDKTSSVLTQKIAKYQEAKVPLYPVSSASGGGALTSIASLNRDLLNAENAMNNEVFLFETPESQWIPSTVYKWADFLDGLNAMHNTGVAGNKYWLLDKNVDDATNSKYAKVAIAAFLAQSMQETIRYNACDENNWSETRYGAPTDYPMSASCGQLGQMYADYGFNTVTGRDHPYSCPRNNKMEVSALTNAKWYGAPAPVFATPDAVLQELGLLVNGHAGRWTNEGHCNQIPEIVDSSKQVWERDECKVYAGQKAGKLIWDGSSKESIQGCGWWGRGVIQTTGRQNFGTLNHYLGRSHVDPDLIGNYIDGVFVEAPPENPLYPQLDFCSDPGLICSSEENAEIKWIAGLFYWVTSVQAYSNEGGPYSSWNYYTELKKYVDGGLRGTEFIDDVSGIVNRGCPDVACETGEVHAMEERRENFWLVLKKLGLNPQ